MSGYREERAVYTHEDLRSSGSLRRNVKKKSLSTPEFLGALTFFTLTFWNGYKPCFKPQLPQLTKVITWVITTVFFTQDCILLINPIFQNTWNRLRNKWSLTKDRTRRSFWTMIGDIVLISLCTAFSFIASASGFANSIDAGTPTGVAYPLWFFHTICLAQQLYRFLVKSIKSLTALLFWLWPGCFSKNLADKIKWRNRCEEVEKIVNYEPAVRAVRTILQFSQRAVEAERRCPLFSMTSFDQIEEYIGNVLLMHNKKNERKRFRKWGERLMNCIKAILYLLMFYTCLVYTGTQTGSIHDALVTDVPEKMRDWYNGEDPKTQGNIVAIVVIALLMQYLRSGINAINHILLYIVRILVECVDCENMKRLFYYFFFLLIAAVLGGLSFSFIYYSSQRGIEDIDFQPFYESDLAELWSRIAHSPERLIGVENLTALFAVISNTSSLLELLHFLKNYWLEGGGFFPSSWFTSSSQNHSDTEDMESRAELVKLSLLRFFQAVKSSVGSRYEDPVHQTEGREALLSPADERNEKVRSAAEELKARYTDWMRPQEDPHEGVLYYESCPA